MIQAERLLVSSMNRKDKDQILVIGVTLAFIVIAVLFYYGTLLIPAIFLAAGTLIVQCLILVPIVNQKYYEVNEASSDWTRWVPFLNEVNMFTRPIAITALTTAICAVVIACSTFLPAKLRAAIVGVRGSIGWGYNAVVFAILVLVVVDIVIGVGCSGVLRHVNLMLQESLGVTMSKVEVAYFFLAFIPCIRMCYFIALNQKLNQLIKLQQMANGEECKEEESE